MMKSWKDFSLKTYEKNTFCHKSSHITRRLVLTKNMNTIRNKSQIYFTLAITVVISFLAACSQEQEQYIPVPATVLARTPHVVNTSPMLSVSGTLQAATTVHLAFQVAGQLREITVLEGDTVAKGQALANLDDKTLKNNLVIAEAKLKEVQKKHKRLSVLYTKGSLTVTDMDKIDAALTVNLATTENIKKQLSDAVLLSPMDGIISRKRAEAGSVVSPGKPILDVVQINYIKAVLSIPESDVSSIHPGQQVKLRLPSGRDQFFKSTIDELLPVSNALTRSYEATCIVNNKENLFHPGSIILATIMLDGTAELITIPGDSILVSPDGDKYVYILTENKGSVLRKQIATKGFYEKEVIVSQGIDKNDFVIIAGQKRLSDGALINLQQAPQAP